MEIVACLQKKKPADLCKCNTWHRNLEEELISSGCYHAPLKLKTPTVQLGGGTFISLSVH